MDTPLFTPLITSYIPALLPRYKTRMSYRHMHAFRSQGTRFNVRVQQRCGQSVEEQGGI